MVDVTIIQSGWDGAGNYWPRETLEGIARRYATWRQSHEVPTAMPIRLGGPKGPPVGHIETMWYDISWNALRASIDCSSSEIDGSPEDALAGQVVALYEVCEAEAIAEGDPGVRVKDAHVKVLFVRASTTGVKMLG